MSHNQFRTHDERVICDDIRGCKGRLEQLVDDFIIGQLPGPKVRRLAKSITDLMKVIITKEEELARIRKMSKEYTRRRS